MKTTKQQKIFINPKKQQNVSHQFSKEQLTALQS